MRLTRSAATYGVGCAMWAAFPLAAGAAMLRVPSQYPTIQSGVDAAAAGDSVLVSAGTWTDYEVRGTRTACVFLKDGVVLVSEDGPSATTIDMQGMGTSQPDVIFGQLLSSGATVVEGFAITGVPTGRAGVFISDSEKVTFRDCVFRDMDGATSTAGLLLKLAAADVIECEFRDLTSTSIGAGLSQTDASLVVDGCTFTNCADRAISCLGTNVGTPESAVIRNSTFIRNSTASAGGGAIAVADYELGGAITGCWFESNVAVVSGGALHIANRGFAPVVVAGCVFWKNSVTNGGGGGGAVNGTGDTDIVGCTFAANVGAFGGAAAIFQSGMVHFENNVVTGSSGAPAVWQGPGASVTPGCNVYWNNGGGDTSGFSMASTSRVVNPLYCDGANGDFTCAQDSPCVPENSLGCGQIGALGQGCGPVSVERRSWGMIKEGYR